MGNVDLLPIPSSSANAEAYPQRPASIDTAYRIEIITELSEIEGLRKSWTSLNGHRDSDIDFYLEFLAASKSVLRPHIIVIYRGTEVESMLVGRLENFELKLRLGYLNLPRITARSLIFMGFLRGQESRETCTLFLDAIGESFKKKDADMAILPLRYESELHKAVLQVGRFGRSVDAPSPSYLLNIPGNYEALSKQFSQGLRYEIKKKKKKIATDFGDRVRFVCYVDATDVENILPKIEEVAKKTYQRALGVGFNNDNQTRRRLLFLAQKGWMRVYLAYVDEQPCAFAIGTLYSGTYISDFVGHDPEFRDYGFGTVIHNYMLEKLCAEGATWLDFGPGDAEYKRRFSNQSLAYTEGYLFASNFRGLRLKCARSAVEQFNDSVKGILNKTNFLPRIKRILRARAEAGSTSNK
jgi:hypothetical protein